MKYNTLQKYILDNSVKEYTKETVNGLFRAILEPIISNQKFESLILIKLNETTNKDSYLKRLSFSNSQIYSFNNDLREYGKVDSSENNIWETSEFLVVLGQRYSAALIWDFSLGETQRTTPVCLIYNSKKINEIAKSILDNSKDNFKDLILKYAPDRRENSILNKSINNLAALIDEKIQDAMFSQAESNNFSAKDDNEEVSAIVAQKAKFIAHEIKNNLSIIGLYSKITEKRLSKTELDEETTTSINTAIKNIEKASQAISYHISDLRCLSAPYMTQIELADVISSTIMLCDVKAKEANIKIEVENIINKSIKADKSKIECALMNVIFNAIEACEGKGTIKINCVEENDTINIYISNDGKEIPKEEQTKIFESDFTTKEKGSGVGLTICKKQLEATNGSLELIKSNSKETIFVIKLNV